MRVAHRGLRGFALGLLLVLGGAGIAAAQPAPWERDEARQEAERVLERLSEIMSQTGRDNAQPAVAAQQDESWIVRLVGAVRLEMLGLDREASRALKAAAKPDAPALGADAAAIKAAQALAAQHQGQGDAEPQEPGELLRVVASVVSEEVRTGGGEAGRKRTLLEGLLAFREAKGISEADQAWLAGRLLLLTDDTVALEDLGAKDLKAAAKEDGEPVYVWYRSNAPYLYWHPGERRLRLDREAREAQKPSAEFRKDHPWRPDEGPHAPVSPGSGR